MTDQNLPFQSNLGLNTEEKQEALISGISLKIRIDNLGEEAQKFFNQDTLQFSKSLLKSLNNLFKDNGLNVHFSDYTADLRVSYPSRKKKDV
jgi:hypothetical protein